MPQLNVEGYKNLSHDIFRDVEGLGSQLNENSSWTDLQLFRFLFDFLDTEIPSVAQFALKALNVFVFLWASGTNTMRFLQLLVDPNDMYQDMNPIL